MQAHDQIASPLANHAVDRRNRALLDNARQKRPMRGIELRRHAGRRNVDETIRPLFKPGAYATNVSFRLVSCGKALNYLDCACSCLRFARIGWYGPYLCCSALNPSSNGP
jgi:hypothetical protein